MGNRPGVCIRLDFSSQLRRSSRWMWRLRKSLPACQRLSLIALLALAAHAQTITTIAGGGPAPNGIKSTGVPIGIPWGVVQDASGNTYISDTQSNRIFEVDASGNFSVVAGSILNNYTGDGGAATAATLSTPRGTALDTTTGALYIADTINNVIRVVNTGTSDITLFTGTLVQLTVHPGDIATVAGSTGGTACVPSPNVSGPQCGDGGFVNGSLLNAPSGVFVDGSGNIFVADTGDSIIREIVTVSGPKNGTIQLDAGNYLQCVGTGVGACGDGGSATSANLYSPNGLWVDTNEDIYIADTNDSAIRVVNAQGVPITVAGVSIPAGAIKTVAGHIGGFCSTGPTTSCGDGNTATSVNALLNLPDGVFVDSSGNIFIADTGDSVVREVNNSTGIITPEAGSYVFGFAGDGQHPVGPQTQLSSPTSVFVTTGGDVFIADQSNSAIREVVGGATGTISTAFGVGLNSSYYGDGGPATPDAEVFNSQGVATDSSGNVYIADTGNNVIRKVDTKGNISTVAGNGSTCVHAIFPCGDGGAATSAQLNSPEGVFVDGSGNIFIADTRDNVIREVVASTGKIQAVVGTEAAFPCTPGALPTCGDGGAAASAQLGLPSAVFLDSSGNIYIADSNNNVVRAVNESGATTLAGVTIAKGDIQVVAGNYTPCTKATCEDGSSAVKAQLNFPEALFVDSAGNIFISDNGDNVIRKVDGTAGTISTVAGDYNVCTTAPCGDGNTATNAQFKNAIGLWVDALGNIFVADAGRSSIRAVNTSLPTVTIAGTTILKGDIDRVVGTAVPGFSGDGGPAGSAQLDRPHGIAADASGDLFITDTAAQRVRKVSGLLGTPATAALSTTTLTFASQDVGSSSTPQSVTVTNNGNVTTLNATVAISGTDAGDFTQGNNCASVAGGSSCSINVTFKPSASGTRTATLTITDNASNSPQTVALSGTAPAPSFTLPKTGTLLNASVSPGGSTTATVTVTSVNNFSASVNLSCSVSPNPTNAPGCQLNPSTVRPQGGSNASATLTVATTSANTAMAPAAKHQSIFYATWLLLPAMLLSTVGMTGSQRKKTISCVLLALAVAGCIFLVACGGGSSTSSNNNNGGGGTGTPSGTYTITVTASSTGQANQTETFTLTVQ